MNSFKYYWITLLIIVLDQGTKLWVRATIPLSREIIKITPTFFWLTHVQNTGAAFSLSLGDDKINRIFFIVFSIVAIIFLFILLNKTKSKLEKITFSMILGGAFGNLIDRIFLGGVTDFIWWDFPDFLMERWPVFNIADSSIVVALVILFVYYVFFEKKIQEKKEMEDK